MPQGQAKTCRALLISWQPKETSALDVSQWVQDLRELLTSYDLKHDDDRSPGEAGTKADIRARFDDATDFVAVGTSEYINKQKDKYRGAAGATNSELWWAIQKLDAEAPDFLLWYAPLQQLQLKKIKLGDCFLGNLARMRLLRESAFPAVATLDGFWEALEQAVNLLLAEEKHLRGAGNPVDAA
jgi:hypothetical protein